MQLKILFYISTIRGGGAARVMTNIANEFAKDFEVHFVTNFPADHEYSLDDRITRTSLEDTECKSSVLKKNISRIKKLRKTINKISPDICVSFMGENNFRLILATMGLRTKKIVSVRNDPNKEYPSAVSRILAKTLYHFVNGVVFQTTDAKEWFPKSIQDKSAIIFNHVDSKFYNEPGDIGKYIIASGRLSKQKNYHMLLNAFSKFHVNYPDQELLIFGEGDMKNDLIKLTHELQLDKVVHFEGFSQNMVDNYKNARFLVMSSDFEGMPNVILEALASSVPVVSTDCPCGGPRMVIDPGVNGYLSSVGNADEFADYMAKMMECDIATFKSNAWTSAQRYTSDKVFMEWRKYIEGMNRE